jgi:hypothetical protein
MSTYHAILSGWRLMAKVAPLVVLAGALKLASHELGFEDLELSPLFSGLVAANVFLIGFLLAGTLGDYKESERLPSDIAAGLEAIADECMVVYEQRRAPEATGCLVDLRALAGSLMSWLRESTSDAGVQAGIQRLNRHFAAFEAAGVQPAFIGRMKNMQSEIRVKSIRIGTIRDTSFVMAGYAVSQVTSLLLIGGLMFVSITPLFQAVFLICVITFLLAYMILLIQDLDNPFQYRGVDSDGEISLRPLEDVVRRIDEDLELVSRSLPAREEAVPEPVT